MPRRFDPNEPLNPDKGKSYSPINLKDFPPKDEGRDYPHSVNIGCPRCDAWFMYLRLGKYGLFLVCPDYSCKGTRNVRRDSYTQAEAEAWTARQKKAKGRNQGKPLR